MRNITGVLLMSVMLLLAACGGGQVPTTKTYTTSQTITLPAGVSNLTLLSGQGGTGSPGTSTYNQTYSDKTVVYNQRNDLGGGIYTLDGGTTYGNPGPTPADYCDPPTPYPQGGVTNYTQTCHDYTDTSYTANNPATTGGTTTMTGPNGFSRSWAGGTGGAATSQTTANVAVTAGGQYVLTIPAGGSITLSYFE